MKQYRWLNIAIFLIVVSSLIPLAFTHAAQADSEKLNLKALTDGADFILAGTVVERHSYWNDEHTRIYTSVILSVDDRLKGTVNQDRVSITIQGGEIEGMKEWVSDMPSFDQGEKTVVFLKKPTEMQLPEEQFEVYHGFRGKFQIRGDRVGNLPVAEFKGRVNKIIARQALPAEELDIAPTPVTLSYSYEGYCWPHLPAPVVPYRINENTNDCTGEGAAVQNAAATWSVPANFSLTYAGTTTATMYRLDGVNEILWRNLGSGSIVAHAIFWTYGSDIVESDVEFNDYYAWSTSSSCPPGYFDVETIGLHELGHWLSLSDLYDPADADKVMYGYGYTGQTKRALTADDIAGIQSIYGASIPDGTQKLLGADDAVAGGPAGANYLLMDRFAAISSGSVSQIRVKCTTAGSVKVALYTDIGGSPGTLITANNAGASVAAGWNNISLSAPVTAGTYYWIAYNSSPACVGYTASAGGAILFRAFTYATDFPGSAGSGFTTSSNYHSLVAGWGVAGPSPLAVTTMSLPDGVVGVAYSQTLQASGGSGSYTWSTTSGSLPAGLSLDTSTGVISGPPTTAAISSFTVEVNDGSTTASQPLSITITVSLQKLMGADDAVAGGAAGAGYLLMDRFAAISSGSVSQIRVKCTTAGSVKVALYTDIDGSPGTLITANNAGASVAAGWNNISLSAPVTAGTYYWIAYNSSSACVGYAPSAGGAILYRAFTYATDFPGSAGAGFATSSGYHSLVAGWGVAGPSPLTITTTSLPDGVVGVAYSQTLHASGGSGSYTWSTTSGSLPAGLSLDTSTGVISGPPTTAATSSFTVEVNDGSTTASQPLSITITVSLQKLLGADDAVAGGAAGANYLLMDRFAAISSGNVSQIRVKCTTAGSVKVALYTDIDGSPGTLITANNTGAIVVAGWNNINLSAPVTAGTYYWIAYNSSPAACVGYAPSAGGAILYRAFTYATDFPGSAGAGFATSSGYHSLVDGWGVAGP